MGKGKDKTTVTRTVKQYSSGSIPPEDFRKLVRLGKSYRSLKNIVFDRYSGATGLPKLYGRNVIEKELLKAGIREELSIPSIYFQMAIKEACGNLKKEWTLTKRRIRNLAERNLNFTGDDVHYIHFILKVEQAFMAVTLRKEPELPASHRKVYEELAEKVNVKRLDSYVRNKARKYHRRLKAVKQDTFSVDLRGYRYRDHGIELASGEMRKRVFIPLTDTRNFDRQLKIRLIPDKRGIEIYAPIEVRVREQRDYINKVGISFDMSTMLTTEKGHEYGAGFKEHPLSYIGQELNRFLEIEKPEAVYLPKYPPITGVGKKDTPRWRDAKESRVYILEHLKQKCEERGCELVRVPGRGINTTCSRCGSLKGRIKEEDLICGACGYKEKVQINSAKNALKRGQTIKVHYNAASTDL